jgi:hypothetical protein
VFICVLFSLCGRVTALKLEAKRAVASPVGWLFSSVAVVVDQSMRLSIIHSSLIPSHVAALSRDLRH